MKALVLRTDFFGHGVVGGSFSHMKGFLDGLQKLGHESAVISSGSLTGMGETQYQIPYSPLYRNLPEVLSIAYNGRILRRAGAIIEREKPDFIYHRHSEFNYSSSVLAGRWRIPLVLEFNGSEVWIKKNWGRMYLKNILTMAEEVQLTAADVITVVSSVLRDELIQSGINPTRVVVNPNGVDPDRFNPSVDGGEIVQRHSLQGKIVAGFVGTFGAWHGVEILARAIRFVVSKNPNVHFLVVGDGNLRGEVERIIREDGVGSFVTLAGLVPHHEIPPYLAACDMLLSPHVQNIDGTEFFGSPTKLFEYMAAGKPIVASPIGQIGTILHDGVNALFMVHRDHEDLASKILLLAGDSDLRKKLGEAARREVVANYSWQMNAQRVIDAVQSLRRTSR